MKSIYFGAMTKFFYILLFLPQICFSQISGVINIYRKVTAVDYLCNKVTVAPDANGYSVGDKILIIQMKGATMDETNSLNFGNVTSYNDAGNYEFGEILTILSNDIYLKHTIQRTYNPSGLVQLISVPQYTDVTISGTLQAEPWNGNTGGVLVFEASGIVTLNADIDVSRQGFRGGNTNNGAGTTCSVASIFANGATTTVCGFKGEGIAEFISTKEAGRGKQVNGGGGGNSNNCGGGGGSNFGSGGVGGSQAFLRTGSSGCNFFGNGNPGIGGLGIPYSNANNKVFMGGGGGGAHQNNWTSPGPPTWVGGTPGGHGGGIVIIRAGTINANSYSIRANGGLSPLSRAWGDGGGGGGGGGAVLLSSLSYSSPLTIEVRGGNGDNVYDETSRDLGPGGGGGGGILWLNSASLPANITLNSSAGQPGVMVGTTTCQCSHNATSGQNGGLLYNLAIPQGSIDFSPPCVSLPVTIKNYSIKFIHSKININWTTASEISNKEFIIEKSKDLSEFEFVTSVKGAGNSNHTQTYTAWDYNPYQGKSYYRLSQVDENGSIQYLKVASVFAESAESLIKKVYPLPFSSNLTIELNENMNEVQINLFNTIGQSVFSTSSKNNSTIQLSLEHLPRGIYFLTVSSGDFKETVKVVKSE